MAENNVAVQEGGSQPKLLLNGVEPTAQQVYDAFMSGPVRLAQRGTVRIPIEIYWENSDGTQTNPKAVTYVEIYCVLLDSEKTTRWTVISVGTGHVE